MTDSATSVVSQLVGLLFASGVIAESVGVNSSIHGDPLEELTPRELQTLELIAEGLSNDAIGERMHVTRSSVEKNLGSVFSKFEIPDEPGLNRRVLAVVKFLESKGTNRFVQHSQQCLFGLVALQFALQSLS